MTRAEQEVHLRRDEETKTWTLFVSTSREARRLQRLGWPLQITDYDKHGNPRGWRADDVDLKAIRFGRLDPETRKVKRKRRRSNAGSFPKRQTEASPVNGTREVM